MPHKTKEEIDSMGTEELVEYLAEQEKFFRNVIDFVERATLEAGERTRFDEHNDYTRTTDEIKNLKGFDLIYDSGHTMFGGNDIIVKKDDDIVLKIYYQVSKEEAKAKFYEDGTWEKEFKELMNKGDKLIEELREEKNEEKLQEERRKTAELVEKEMRKNAIDDLINMGLYPRK